VKLTGVKHLKMTHLLLTAFHYCAFLSPRRKLTDSLRCIDEKFLGCVSSAAKWRAALELKHAANFLRDLCNDSGFQRGEIIT
jgi:hypothetical protein